MNEFDRGYFLLKSSSSITVSRSFPRLSSGQPSDCCIYESQRNEEHKIRRTQIYLSLNISRDNIIVIAVLVTLLINVNSVKVVVCLANVIQLNSFWLLHCWDVKAICRRQIGLSSFELCFTYRNGDAIARFLNHPMFNMKRSGGDIAIITLHAKSQADWVAECKRTPPQRKKCEPSWVGVGPVPLKTLQSIVAR